MKKSSQKRLDEVAGAFNWKNVYSLWHDNSQICGISIFNAERNEWVTKYDGAENSDFEPIKGGLSDSFKRAASAWGVGRYLYELDGIWVDVEAKGKSCAIKESQLGKLEAAYNAAVGKIFGAASSKAESKQIPAETKTETPPEKTDYDFKVNFVKPSGQSSQLLELVGGNGEVVTAYIKKSDSAIISGSRLRGVQI